MKWLSGQRIGCALKCCDPLAMLAWIRNIWFSDELKFSAYSCVFSKL